MVLDKTKTRQNKELKYRRKNIVWIKPCWRKLVSWTTYFQDFLIWVNKFSKFAPKLLTYRWDTLYYGFFNSNEHHCERIFEAPIFGYLQTIFFRRYLSSLFCLVLVLCSRNSYQFLTFFLVLLTCFKDRKGNLNCSYVLLVCTAPRMI